MVSPCINSNKASHEGFPQLMDDVYCFQGSFSENFHIICDLMMKLCKNVILMGLLSSKNSYLVNMNVSRGHAAILHTCNLYSIHTSIYRSE